MSDGIFYGALFGIGIILFVCNVIYSEKMRKKAFLQKLKEQWGKFSETQYGYEEFECISHYFNAQKDGLSYYVDDITWNDLDMDSIFQAMNHTQSSLGAEQLYLMLRTPVVEPEILKEREQLIQYMSEHSKERIKLQGMFAGIGKTKAYAITDYMSMLDGIKIGHNGKHYLAAAMGVCALASLLWNPVIGIVILSAVFAFCASTYYGEKAKVEPYLVSFAYLLRMMKAAEMLQKESLGPLEKYQKELRQLNKEFAAFRKNSGLVMSIKNSGSPLDAIFDYVRMFFHVDLIKFNKMAMVLKNKKTQCERMIEIMGTLEAVIAIASFRQALPYYAIPQLVQTNQAYLKVTELYHPLIEEAVSNDMSADRGVLITGSNASGKSTFLKTLAINAILSQSIHTSIAKTYQASLFRIFSSMSLRDNLSGNESYYMVEIKSIRRILEAAKEKETPMLSFVDEVLRGTNTVERIAASSHILRGLNQSHVLSFAATHDIELTYLLEEEYDNFHFTEEIKEGDILFSYKVFEGRAQSRNAIKLLELMGYEKDIVTCAEQCAKYFLETGQWKM